MNSLKGKVIAVTGASGIAAASARRFAAEGARVQVFSLDGEEAAAVATELGDGDTESFWAAVDLADGDATEAAFAAGRTRLGRLDGLFAVAGGSGRRFGDGRSTKPRPGAGGPRWT